MQFGFIAPTKMLNPLSILDRNKFHLTLAHLVAKDMNYKGLYRKFKDNNPDSYVIMDNSGFEMFKLNEPFISGDSLIALATDIKADCIVLPDRPGVSSTLNRKLANQFNDRFIKAGFDTFYVPQSEIGDIDDLRADTLNAIACGEFDYVGISILAVPNGYGVEQKNNLQRYLSRYHFMKELNELSIIHHGMTIDELKAKNDVKIHFLGMVDGPNEISLMQNLLSEGVTIDTWDSSSPVWHGYEGITYDKSPTGLINGKCETHVNFNAPMTMKVDTRAKMQLNIIAIEDLVESYNMHTKEPVPADTDVKAINYRFNEDTALEELVKYIKGTYSQHYVMSEEEDENPVQLLDLMSANESEFVAFNRWSGMKYLARFGKKDGYNVKDLLKTAHYTILLLGQRLRINARESK